VVDAVGWVLYSDQTAIRAGHIIFLKLVVMRRWKNMDGCLFYNTYLGSC
jgi:hypothetical protein